MTGSTRLRTGQRWFSTWKDVTADVQVCSAPGENTVVMAAGRELEKKEKKKEALCSRE